MAETHLKRRKKAEPTPAPSEEWRMLVYGFAENKNQGQNPVNPVKPVKFT